MKLSGIGEQEAGGKMRESITGLPEMGKSVSGKKKEWKRSIRRLFYR